MIYLIVTLTNLAALILIIRRKMPAPFPKS